MPQVFFSEAFARRAANQDFDWTAYDIDALLLDDSQATDRSREFVSELSGEYSDASYSRVDVTTRVSELNTTQSPNARRLTADDVTFPSLADNGSQVVDRMVMFVLVTDDTDSWIIGYFEVRRGGDPVTPNGDDLIIPPDGDDGYISLEEG